MLASKVRSRKTFEKKITHKSPGTQESYGTLLNRWEKYGKEKFNNIDIIPDLKLVEEETLWDTLQDWINWNVDTWKPQVNKYRFGQLRKYLHHRGIKIYKEDIEDNLDFPTPEQIEYYPLSLDEAQTIIANATYKKKVMYLCQISSGMRIGELVQIKPKHLDLEKKRIMIKIPASMAKYNKARKTFFSAEAEKMLRPILKKLDENERIFGTHDNVKYAETNEIQQLKRLLMKIGLYERQENGHGSITSHSFRAYFITKVSRFDRDLAHFLAGQKNKVYLTEYDRLTDDEKLDLYLKIEPELLINDNTRQKAELDKVNKEKSKLKIKESEIIDLQKQFEDFKKESRSEIEKLKYFNEVSSVYLEKGEFPKVERHNNKIIHYKSLDELKKLKK